MGLEQVEREILQEYPDFGEAELVVVPVQYWNCFAVVASGEFEIWDRVGFLV